MTDNQNSLTDKPEEHAIQVTILSRPGCHLCEVVAKVAHRLQSDMPFNLSQVNIDEDAALSARYGSRIPVVLIDHVERLSGRVMERDLRQAIKRARWRRPISRILFHLRQGLRWR